MNSKPATKVEAQILATIKEVDLLQRHGGLVPIPAIRTALPKMARKTLDSALLGMEKNYVVDLKTSNDPRLIDEPALCIRRPDGAYLEFVVVR
jgi:hypothetical protein